MNQFRFYSGEESDLDGMTRSEVIEATFEDMDEVKEWFTDMVNGAYPPVVLGGIEYDYVHVWESVDPTAFILSAADMVVEINTDYYPEDDDD